MLLVDLDALTRVNVLNRLHEAVHRGRGVSQRAKLLEVGEALRESVAGTHLLARDKTLGHVALGDASLEALLSLRVDNTHDNLAVVGRDAQNTGDGGQKSLTATDDLGILDRDDVEGAGDEGQALRNVFLAGNAAGVNGTHRKLRTRLADRLSGDGANSRTDVDRTTVGEVPAVALLAHAVLAGASNDGAKHDLGEARIGQAAKAGAIGARVGKVLDAGNVAVLVGQHLAGCGIDDDLGNATADEVALQTLLVEQRVLDELGGAAVLDTDDNVLGNVDETTRQVTGVGGVRRRVDEALTGAVGRQEVLERGEALAEVGLNGQLQRVGADDLEVARVGVGRHRALRVQHLLGVNVGHKAAHTSELTELRDGASSTGVCHHEDGVLAGKALLHLLGNVLGGNVPHVDNRTTTFVHRDQALLGLLIDLDDGSVGSGEDLCLCLTRDDGVPHRDGETGAGGVVEADRLETVEDDLDLRHGVLVAAVVDQQAHVLLLHLEVDEGVGVGKHRVEDDAAHGGRDARAGLVSLRSVSMVELVPHDSVAGQANHDGVVEGKTRASLVGVLGIGEVAVLGKVGTLVDLVHRRDVVHTDDHVLRGDSEHLAGSRRTQVVGRQHQDAGLGLGLGAQRHVDRHLVAVEVGVEGRTHERVQVDCLTLDEDGLERLNGQTVQGRCTVEQHESVGDDLLEHVPHEGLATVDGTLGGLDVLGASSLDKTLHDERLEQLERHGLGQAALVQLELGVDDDDRTAGVVDALAEQVLTEAALLALERLCERLERTTTTTRDGTTATAVVEQGVHGLLKHALLIVHDDGRGVEVEQTLEAVVAVDDATVQVVEVGSSEATTVELHHGAQVGRNDRHDVEDHVGRRGAALEEGVDNLEALDGLGALLALALLHDDAKLLSELVEVHAVEKVADGLGAHAALEVHGVVLAHLAEKLLVGDEVLDLELHELVEGLLAKPLLVLGLFLGVGEVLLELGGIKVVLGVGLVLLSLGAQLLNRTLIAGLNLLEVALELLAKVGLVGLAALGVEARDDVRRKVKHLLEILVLDLEDGGHGAGGRALEVPDVRDGRSKFDVAHAVAAHLGARNLNAAALADDVLETDALVLAARALPVLGRTKDLLAEKTVLLRLEGAVVDGLGLLYLSPRPTANLVGRGKADADSREIVVVEISHCYSLSLSLETRLSIAASNASKASASDASEAIMSPARSLSEDSSIFSSATAGAAGAAAFLALTGSTSSARERISLTRTLKDSGTPFMGMLSPLTMDS